MTAAIVCVAAVLVAAIVRDTMLRLHGGRGQAAEVAELRKDIEIVEKWMAEKNAGDERVLERLRAVEARVAARVRA